MSYPNANMEMEGGHGQFAQCQKAHFTATINKVMVADCRLFSLCIIQFELTNDQRRQIASSLKPCIVNSWTPGALLSPAQQARSWFNLHNRQILPRRINQLSKTSQLLMTKSWVEQLERWCDTLAGNLRKAPNWAAIYLGQFIFTGFCKVEEVSL